MRPTAAEHRLLTGLLGHKALPIDQAAEACGFASQAQVLAAGERLVREGFVAFEERTLRHARLTDEGRRVGEAGLPERRLLQAILEAGGSMSMADASQRLEKSEVPVAVGWLKRRGWGRIEKGETTLLVAAGDAEAAGDEEVLLRWVQHDAAPGEVPETLVQRGLVVLDETTERSVALTADGTKVAQELGEPPEDVAQVSPELVALWGEMTDQERDRIHLRPFDTSKEVAARLPGKPHPLSQLMAQVRRIFWQMGFTEIEGDYVESAYWNMDALFIPQDHPARELQDTFYLDEPAQLAVGEDLLDRTAQVHRDGGTTGSTGWGGAFDPAVSRKALLRTHTTNTSIRYLAEHFGDAASDEDAEGSTHRIFGLGRVFRNETMDATHLPEFHQIEGILTEPGASFDMLVGLCRHFFKELGFPQVRFRPAYFPYTEPSMEIEVHYHGRWMELGGCGIFRPEVTEPLGVSHPVLAWGFGLERLAMMRLGIKDIRQLVLPDLEWLSRQPLL